MQVDIVSQQSIQLELTGQTGGVSSVEILPGGLTSGPAVTVELAALGNPSFTIDGVATNIEISQDVVVSGGDNTALTTRVDSIETTLNTLVNKKPTIPAQTGSINDVGPTRNSTVFSGAVDLNGDTLSVVGVSYSGSARSVGSSFATTYGTMVIRSDGSYSFSTNSVAQALKSGQTATEVFSYTATDGQGANVTSSLTLTIVGQNNSPVAIADAGIVPYNTVFTGNVISNDYDPDLGSLSLTQFLISGDATIYTPGQTATISGKGTLLMNSTGSFVFTPNNNFSGSLPVITYAVSNGSLTTTGVLTLAVSPAPTDVVSDPVTTALTGAHATYNVYSDTDMNNVPWGALVAGDVVNIYHKATPYRAKVGLRAQGTQLAPVIINGVTDASGNRPVFDWSTGAFTATGCNPSGSFGGAQDVFGTVADYGEGLGGFVIKRGASDPGGTYLPKWITIQNLELRNATGTYTKLGGGNIAFIGTGGVGNGIYILMSEDCTIENCVIHGNCFGVFTQSNNEELGYTSSRLKIRNNRIYNNGINGSFLEHNCYIQAASPIVEGNFLGQLRAGAIGSTYKSRSSGEIFRYNWVEASSRAIDFVQSEDNTNGIAAQPDYPITWCYGNTIINDETLPQPTAYVPVHFGGDNGGEQEGSTVEYVPATPYRNQLYFWNNTYYQRKTTVSAYKTVFFDLSLRSTRVDAWNNIFIAIGNSVFSWVEHCGIVNLRGINWVQGTVQDAIAEALPVNYQINKIGTLLTGDPFVQDANNRDFFLQYSSSCIDAATVTPSGLPDTTIATAKPVEYQPRKGVNGLVVRIKDGAAYDLGSTEYNVGYTPAPPPVPSVTVVPSISGSKVQGATLTCNVGTWTGRPAFTYQWKRDTVDISGATSSTFVTTGADFHKNITCTVTGTNSSGSSSSTTSAVYIIGATAPLPTSAPVLSGTPTEGYSLSCSTGVWTNSPDTYTYQWLLDGVEIVGATASSYLLQIGQGNKVISCRVTATNASDSNSEVSNSLSVALAPADPDPQGTWNFSAANGTTLASLSSSWRNGSSSGTDRMECLDGALQCVAGMGSNSEAVWLPIATSDSFAEIKMLANWGGQFRIGLRTSDTLAGYSVVVQPANITFYRHGAWTTSWSNPAATTSDLYVKLSYVSNVFTCWINGTQLFTHNESTPVTGGGIYLSLTPGANVSDQRIDYLKTANI